MYQLLTLLNGAICAVMIAINGPLPNHYGLFTATVIIHIVGTLFSLGVLLVRRDKIRPPKGLPLWMYLGGAIGLLTSLSNNFCIGKISITSILALGLFGQAVTALVIDRTGLLGMEKRPSGPPPWWAWPSLWRGLSLCWTSGSTPPSGPFLWLPAAA